MEEVPSHLSALAADHSGGGRLSPGLRKKKVERLYPETTPHPMDYRSVKLVEDCKGSPDSLILPLG